MHDTRAPDDRGGGGGRVGIRSVVCDHPTHQQFFQRVQVREAVQPRVEGQAFIPLLHNRNQKRPLVLTTREKKYFVANFLVKVAAKVIF